LGVVREGEQKVRFIRRGGFRKGEHLLRDQQSVGRPRILWAQEGTKDEVNFVAITLLLACFPVSSRHFGLPF
jgi:hypothetical protein